MSPAVVHVLAVLVLIAGCWAATDDPRVFRWIRRKWRQRNLLPPPDDACDRSINTGPWT